ncbi:MAG TPA: recombinase family protein [Gemmataceae bacterium]|jgi:DNA invertase Pin-like site-specific DNA recombinase
MSSCLIYCRVSTEEQADKGYSLDTQEKLCRDFAQRSGYSVSGVYRDEGKSGTSLGRPALQDLLAQCGKGTNIQAVIVQETDRLARNTHDHLTIRALLQKAGVKLISVAQPMLDDSPEGKMIDTILASVNQFQSDINSRKTRKALQEKFDQGWWPTRAALGYLNVALDNSEGGRSRKIVRNDPERWHLLQEGFKLYLTGAYSADALRDVLHEKGLRSITGKKISHSIMVHILKNPFYAGLMVWNGQRKMGRHEPMITLQEHESVLAIMDRHNNHAARSRRHRFLLRGFVFCGLCGQRYTAEHHPRKRKSYYHCATMQGHSNRNQNVEISELERQVEEQFKTIQFRQDLIDKFTDKLRYVRDQHLATADARRQVLHNQQNAIEIKLRRAEEKLLTGVLVDDAFVRIRTDLGGQLQGIQVELAALDNQRVSDSDVIRSVVQLTRNVHQEYTTVPEGLKRQYLGLFWERFVVQDRQIVQAIPCKLMRALQEEGRVINRYELLPLSPLIITFSDKGYLVELAAKVRAIEEYRKNEGLELATS